MGGINHHPSSIISEGVTVAQSEALSWAMAEFMLGNAAIEQVIQSGSNRRFGVGRSQLEMAIGHFSQAHGQLSIFANLGREILDLLERSDYEPPMPLSTLDDPDRFLGELFSQGLLPQSAAANTIIERLKADGYVGGFQLYNELAAGTQGHLDALMTLTARMRDGQEGFQGLFWPTVETNRVPWRQAFALPHTALQGLMASFQAGALISTETYLHSTGAPGLLDNLDAIPAGAVNSVIS